MILNGKTALITGGARGIGKAIALEFVKSGAKVMIVSRTEKELIEASAELNRFGQAFYCVGDVSSISSVSFFVRKAVELLSHIDILVSCAGIYGPKGLFHTLNMQEWEDAININFLGAVRTIHEALPFISENGAVVAIGGARVPSAFPRFSCYSSSKAGLVQFLTGLAKEYPKIRFNSIAPGAVNTRIVDDALAAGPEAVGKEFYEENIKWKRNENVVAPEFVAKFVVGLVRNDCKVSGKYLSPVWDSAIENSSEEMFTLKRIDGRNFIKK